jgi:hypothetical protein
MYRLLLCLMLLSTLPLTGFACTRGDDAPVEAMGSDIPAPPKASVDAAISTSGPPPAAYVNFVINVHDWKNIDDSAATILRLIDLFERYGVRGEFYVTAPMIHAYEDQHPEVIARLRDSDMTISYHARAPHPATHKFGQVFEGKTGEALAQALRDYETYRLDMRTGELITDEWGGYAYVKQVLGRPPVVASMAQKSLRSTALPIFAEMGAAATVVYHEEGTDPDQPFAYTQGLLERPSDLSITRWPLEPGGNSNFWWNYLDHPKGAGQTPEVAMKAKVAAWSGDRPPFITSLIHENNFYRKGATPFAQVYYTDKTKKHALQAPYDLDAADPSRARTQQNQDQIWQAYEDMVRHASQNLKVVTSADIVQLAMNDSAQAPGQQQPATAPAERSGGADATPRGDGSAQIALGVMVHLEGWKGRDQQGFDRYARIIRGYARQFEQHGAKLTFEAKEPIDHIPQYGDNFLAELEGRGHGVGVHADMGFNRGGPVDYDDFARDLRQRRVDAKKLGVEVRHVSGICSAEDWVSAAIEAGYLFHTGDVGFCFASMPREDRPPQFKDCKAPGACHDPAVSDLADRLHPWRAKDGATWFRHDPKGKLVIIPSSHTLECYHEATTSTGNHLKCDIDQADIDAFVGELEQAIAMADPSKVNTLYVAWSLGRPIDEAWMERWLTAIDPFVASGSVVWATLPEMYDMVVEAEGL